LADEEPADASFQGAFYRLRGLLFRVEFHGVTRSKHFPNSPTIPQLRSTCASGNELLGHQVKQNNNTENVSHLIHGTTDIRENKTPPTGGIEKGHGSDHFDTTAARST
jgi:hypothetical protein